MLSMQDIVDYCDLETGEIEAIAEHEHVPMIIAAELGQELLTTPQGVCCVHAMIIENMEHALACGEFQHVKDLSVTYQHLQRTHPIPTRVSG